MAEIKVKDATLAAAAAEGNYEFVDVFAKAYLDVLGGELRADNMNLLTGEQHAILSYHIFCEEVIEGGFVQLIQNGYGSYIFDNPFAKAMRLFGADEFSKLVYKAKKIYDENRKDLEQETTDDEFMAMYERYPKFDELEEDFFEIDEDTAHAIALYIDEHIELFAQIEE